MIERKEMSDTDVFIEQLMVRFDETKVSFDQAMALVRSVTEDRNELKEKLDSTEEELIKMKMFNIILTVKYNTASFRLKQLQE